MNISIKRMFFAIMMSVEIYCKLRVCKYLYVHIYLCTYYIQSVNDNYHVLDIAWWMSILFSVCLANRITCSFKNSLSNQLNCPLIFAVFFFVYNMIWSTCQAWVCILYTLTQWFYYNELMNLSIKNNIFIRNNTK